MRNTPGLTQWSCQTHDDTPWERLGGCMQLYGCNDDTPWERFGGCMQLYGCNDDTSWERFGGCM